jgi:hypothetical protein
MSYVRMSGLMAEITTGVLHPDWSLPRTRIKLDGRISIYVPALELIAPQLLSRLLHRSRPTCKDGPNGPHVLPTPFRPIIRRSTKFTHMPRPPRQSTLMGRNLTSQYDRTPTLFPRQHAPSGRTRYACSTPFEAAPAGVYPQSDFRRITRADGDDASGSTSFLGTEECATTYPRKRGTEETGRDGWILEYGTFPYSIRMDWTGIIVRD